MRRTLANAPASIAWLVLMAATCVSWRLGGDHRLGEDGRTAATSIVLTVAFVKVHIVGMHFMELRDAPLPLRLLFDAWVIAVGVAVNLLFVLR